MAERDGAVVSSRGRASREVVGLLHLRWATSMFVLLMASCEDAATLHAELDARARDVVPPEAPEREAGSEDGAASPVPRLPLPLCRKYFTRYPGQEITRAIGSFFRRCENAGLFVGTEPSGYLQYLRDWSLLAIGCETRMSVPGGLAVFAPLAPFADAGVAQVDVERVIEHWLLALRTEVALSPEDEAELGAALLATASSLSRCACEPRLARCAMDAGSAP